MPSIESCGDKTPENAYRLGFRAIMPSVPSPPGLGREPCLGAEGVREVTGVAVAAERGDLRRQRPRRHAFEMNGLHYLNVGAVLFAAGGR